MRSLAMNERLGIRLALWVMVAIGGVAAGRDIPSLPQEGVAKSGAALVAFEAGDTWRAVGDSITHSGNWHKWVMWFAATRHPERRIHFSNAGLAGDLAGGVLRRYEWDVACQPATFTTVMLGMNDVGRHLYAASKPGNEEQKRARIAQYRDRMRECLLKLRRDGGRVWVFSPTHYDATAKIAGGAEAASAELNDALGECTEIARQLAAECSMPFLELHGPLTKWTTARQLEDPGFSLLLPDRVHPNEIGAWVMAGEMLKAQGETGPTCRVEIDAPSMTVKQSLRCRVEKLLSTPDGIVFQWTGESLPVFGVPGEVLRMQPEWQEWGRQELRISGLDDGPYTLSAEGKPVGGPWTGKQLAEGVDLTQDPQNPARLQSAVVADLNQRRHDLICTQLRSFAYVRAQFPSGKVRPDVVKKRAQGSSWVAQRYRIFLEDSHREEELCRQARDLEDEMWRQAKPRSFLYLLRR